MKLYASETYAEQETIQIAGKEFTGLELATGDIDLSAGGVVAGVDLAPTTTVTGNTLGIIDSTVDLSGISSGYGFDGVTGNYENVTIQNAKSGAIYTNDKTSAFKDVLFVNNSNSGTGGALNAKSNTTITGGTFLNNTKASHGGAIFTASGSGNYTLSVQKTLFHSNNATSGGAVRVDNAAVISGATFTGNESSYGGAINIEGTCTVNEKTSFINNTATEYGGAIYVLKGTFTANDCYFANNSAKYAGAVYVNSGATATITGSTFYQNSQSGAAAVWNNGGNLTVTNTLFYGNSGDTGALLSEGASASLIVSGSTFATASDKIKADSLTFQGENTLAWGISAGTHTLDEGAGLRFQNTISEYINFGGASLILQGNNYFVFDNTQKAVLFYNDVADASFTVTQNLLENCSSGYLIAADFTNGWNGTSITVEGYGDVGNGEKFVIDGYEYALSVIDKQLKISSKRRVYDIVYVDSDNNGVVIGGETITEGVFTSETDARNAMVTGGTIVFDGMKVENQSVSGSSSVINYGTQKAGVVNSVFQNNSNQGHGSGIKIYGGQLTLNNVSFIDNSSTQSVGAVWVEGANTTAEISNCFFSGNKAGTAGAIFMDNNTVTVTISGSTFQTETDTINNQNQVIFKDTNYLNATINGTAADTTTLAENAVLVFGNTTAISINTATVFEGSNGLVFNGSATVAFNGADLSNVAITVSAGIFNTAGAVIVSGISTLADGKVITVKNGDEIVGEYEVGKEFSYNGDKYTFVSNGNLTFDKSKPEVVYVQLNGSGEVVIGGETISKGVFNTIDEAKAAVAANGTIYVYSLDTTERMTFSSAVKTVFVDGKISGVNVIDSGNDGAIFQTAGNLTISGGTYSGNTARYGGAIRITDGSQLIIQDNALFDNNTAGHGSAVAVASGSELTVNGATFMNSTSLSGAGAIWVSGTATITNALFYNNYGNSSGALHIDSNNVVVSGSTFATAKDTIGFGGTFEFTFAGTNTLNADIKGANGTVKLADNAILKFDNSSDISVQAPLAFAGDGDDADEVAAYGMIFKGTGKVTFKSDTDLSNVNITVAAELPVVEADFITVAANVAEIDLDKVFINSEAVGTDGEIIVNGLKYTVGLINNSLVVSRYAEKHDVTYAQLNGTGVVEGVEAGIYDTVDKAEKYVNAGGTVNILNMENSGTRYEFSVSGAQSLTVFDNAYFHDITVGRNSVMRLNANQEVVVTNSTFANNASVDPGSGHNSALGFNSGAATVSVKNSKFLDNSAATIIGALLFNANTGVVENCYFSGNTANGERNGAAIYVDDGGNVTVSGSTFATTSDQVYSRGASFTFSGENTTAASICHHYSIAAGLYGTMTMAENATLKFVNTELIEVNNLTFAGNNTLTFAGSAAVDFWNLDWTDSENYTIDDVDLSSVNITVDTTGFNGGFKTIATGVSAFDADKVNSGEYQMMLVNNKLMLHDSTVNEISDSGIRETNNGTDLLTTIAGDYDGKVFGGSKNGSDGALLIDFKSGTVNGNIVGGGEVGAASTAIEISGTAVAKKSVYAGVFATTAGLDTESSSLTISGGSIESYVTGGSRVHNVQHHTDLVTVTIDGGDFADGVDVFNAGFLVGNGTAAGNEATLTVSKAVTNLAGATISGEVYGGASVHKNGYAKVDDVEINISGGTYANVFGGGWAQQGSRSDVGSVNITIDGGYVANLYAGGNNAAVENNQFSTSTVTGDVTITAEGGKFGNIYLCGKYTGSAVLGDITLTLDGSRNIELISGISVNGLADTDSITKVEITSDSKVTCSAIDTIDMLVIDENATLTLDSINNVSEISFNTDGGSWDAMVTADFDSLNFAGTTFALGEWSGSWDDLLANYGSIADHLDKDGNETGLKKLVITLA